MQSLKKKFIPFNIMIISISFQEKYERMKILVDELKGHVSSIIQGLNFLFIYECHSDSFYIIGELLLVKLTPDGPTSLKIPG